MSDERDAYDADGRDITLRIDIESVSVHVVRSVQFHYDSYEVRRHRWEKSDAKF